MGFGEIEPWEAKQEAMNSSLSLSRPKAVKPSSAPQNRFFFRNPQMLIRFYGGCTSSLYTASANPF